MAKWLKYLNCKSNKEIEDFARVMSITPMQAKLLINRGIDTKQKAYLYMYGGYKDLYPCSDLKDIDIAAKLVCGAQNILVYGDYDVDGITSTALITKAIRYLGKKCTPYIPKRMTDGYGININRLEKLLEEGSFDLVITVDNGIAAVKEADFLKNKKIKYVITDHHECPEALPVADAIVNPHRPDDTSKNKNLCGCTVAFKLIQKIFEILKISDEGFLKTLLGYTALATVADVMPLTGENRIFVTEGLTVLNENKLPGITELADILNISEITSEKIGFQIGPCINSDGRLYDGETAFRLMLADNYAEASVYAEMLVDMNNERKDLTTKYFTKLDNEIRSKNQQNNSIIVTKLDNEPIPEGIIGILASKVEEKYGVPAIVFTKGKDYFKGSGRCPEHYPISLFEMLQATSDFWEKGGGHKCACGVSVKLDDNAFSAFESAVIKYTDKAIEEQGIPDNVIYYDDELDIDNLSVEICTETEILQPVGLGNPSAKFVTVPLPYAEAKPIGNGSHIAFSLENQQKEIIKAVAFNKTHLFAEMSNPEKLKFLYVPTINHWEYTSGGKTIRNSSIQMMCEDFQAPVKDRKKIISALKKIKF